MDFITLKKLDTLLNNESVFGYQLKDKNKRGSIANAFMMSIPNHDLFKNLVSGLSKTKNLHVLKATGPEYLTNMIKNYNGNDITLYEMPLIYTNEWNDKNNSLKICEKRYRKM